MPRKAQNTATQNTATQDKRLIRSDAQDTRETRSTAEPARTDSMSATSFEERMQRLREAEGTEILPNPPHRPGWVRCWLSTTNPSDSIISRVRKGWTPVKVVDVPEMADYVCNDDSKYNGVVAHKEMLLFEIPKQGHDDLMVYYHHVKPNEEEEGIRQKLQQRLAAAGTTRDMGIEEESGFKELGKAKTPIFNC